MGCSQENLRLGTMSKGFTLIEVMVTAVIIGILASIAYPAYTEQVAKGRRADARARLMAAQQWMERYYTERYSYASAGQETKNADFAKQSQFVVSPAAGEGAAMYDISVEPTLTDYTLKAIRISSSAMKSDACGDLTLNKVGTKSVLNYDKQRFASLDAAVAACWK